MITAENEIWLAPPIVATPNIWEDVKKYCGVQYTQDEFNGLEKKIKDKLTVLAERLEFIDHLLLLWRFIYKNTESVKKIERIDDEKSNVTTDYRFILNGHDLAGAQFDIEALVFYLLITCVDTIKVLDYKEPFEWLSEKAELLAQKNDESSVRVELKNLNEEYKAKYGLSKRFKEAFTDNLSEKLQDKLIESLIFVSVERGEIRKDSLTAWNELNQREKIKKLADKLYKIRSDFTHSSIRTFLPAGPLSSVPSLKGKYLLCKMDFNLIDTLTEIIQYLIQTQLIDSNKKR